MPSKQGIITTQEVTKPRSKRQGNLSSTKRRPRPPLPDPVLVHIGQAGQPFPVAEVDVVLQIPESLWDSTLEVYTVISEIDAIQQQKVSVDVNLDIFSIGTVYYNFDSTVEVVVNLDTLIEQEVGTATGHIWVSSQLSIDSTTKQKIEIGAELIIRNRDVPLSGTWVPTDTVLGSCIDNTNKNGDNIRVSSNQDGYIKVMVFDWDNILRIWLDINTDIQGSFDLFKIAEEDEDWETHTITCSNRPEADGLALQRITPADQNIEFPFIELNSTWLDLIKQRNGQATILIKSVDGSSVIIPFFPISPYLNYKYSGDLNEGLPVDYENTWLEDIDEEHPTVGGNCVG
jgi:hypothetical protein